MVSSRPRANVPHSYTSRRWERSGTATHWTGDSRAKQPMWRRSILALARNRTVLLQSMIRKRNFIFWITETFTSNETLGLSFGKHQLRDKSPLLSRAHRRFETTVINGSRCHSWTDSQFKHTRFSGKQSNVCLLTVLYSAILKHLMLFSFETTSNKYRRAYLFGARTMLEFTKVTCLL